VSGKNPSSAGSVPGSPGGKPRALLCEEWEALLVDALDGTLAPTESAAFEAHRESCLACAQLLEEAKRGSEWLHFLETEPEVPIDLVGRILAKTSGPTATLPMEMPAIGGFPGMGGSAVAMPAQIGWTGSWLPRMERHASQSRWMMTAAMAFFSIAFIVNQTGLKLSSVRLADLRPTTLVGTLTRQFYAADAHVMRYYDSVRFVYELESRVKEMRRDTQSSPAPAPVPIPVPGGTKDSPDTKPAVKHSGGSAQRQAPPADPLLDEAPGPVIARLEQSCDGFGNINTTEVRDVNAPKKSALPDDEGEPSAIKTVRTERSLA
jgi:hypothetical protein